MVTPGITPRGFSSYEQRIIRVVLQPLYAAINGRIAQGGYDYRALSAAIQAIPLDPNLRTMSVAQATAYTTKIQQQHLHRFRRTMSRALGVAISPLTPELGIAALMQRAIADNVALITTLPARHKQLLTRRLTRLADTAPFDQSLVMDAVRQSRLSSARQARLIARDQTSKLIGNLNQARQEQIGVAQYRWRTSQDEAVRPSHRANDGRIFRWDSPPPTGHPGHDINCRCVALPIIPPKGTPTARRKNLRPHLTPPAPPVQYPASPAPAVAALDLDIAPPTPASPPAAPMPSPAAAALDWTGWEHRLDPRRGTDIFTFRVPDGPQWLVKRPGRTAAAWRSLDRDPDAYKWQAVRDNARPRNFRDISDAHRFATERIDRHFLRQAEARLDWTAWQIATDRRGNPVYRLDDIGIIIRRPPQLNRTPTQWRILESTIPDPDDPPTLWHIVQPDAAPSVSWPASSLAEAQEQAYRMLAARQPDILADILSKTNAPLTALPRATRRHLAARRQRQETALDWTGWQTTQSPAGRAYSFTDPDRAVYTISPAGDAYELAISNVSPPVNPIVSMRISDLQQNVAGRLRTKHQTPPWRTTPDDPNSDWTAWDVAPDAYSYTDADGAVYRITRQGPDTFALRVQQRGNGPVARIAESNNPSELRQTAGAYLRDIGLTPPWRDPVPARHIFTRRQRDIFAARRAALRQFINREDVPDDRYLRYQPITDSDGWPAWSSILPDDNRQVIVRRQVLLTESDGRTTAVVPRLGDWTALVIERNGNKRLVAQTAVDNNINGTILKIEQKIGLRPTRIDSSAPPLSANSVGQATPAAQLPRMTPAQQLAVPCPRCGQPDGIRCVVMRTGRPTAPHIARRRAAAMTLGDEAATAPPPAPPMLAVSRSDGSAGALDELGERSAVNAAANRPGSELSPDTWDYVDDYQPELTYVLRNGGDLNEGEQDMLAAVLSDMREVGEAETAYLRLGRGSWGDGVEAGDVVALDAPTGAALSWRGQYQGANDTIVEFRMGARTQAIISEDLPPESDVLIGHGQYWRVREVRENVNYGDGMLVARRYVVLEPEAPVEPWRISSPIVRGDDEIRQSPIAGIRNERGENVTEIVTVDGEGYFDNLPQGLTAEQYTNRASDLTAPALGYVRLDTLPAGVAKYFEGGRGVRINAALRRGEVSGELDGVAWSLEEILSTMRPAAGRQTLYRGIKDPPPAWGNLAVGDVLTPDLGLQSTSRMPGYAAHWSNYRLVLQIKTRRGTLQLATNPMEGEVLLPPGLQYRVTRIADDQPVAVPGNELYDEPDWVVRRIRRVIYLEEIDPAKDATAIAPAPVPLRTRANVGPLPATEARGLRPEMRAGLSAEPAQYDWTGWQVMPDPGAPNEWVFVLRTDETALLIRRRDEGWTVTEARGAQLGMYGDLGDARDAAYEQASFRRTPE